MPKKTNLKVVPPQQKEAWEEELAAKAKDEKAVETLGVPRLTHSGGILQIGDKRVDGNRLAIIVVAVVYMKQWQEFEYVKGSKDTPGCYSFSLTGDKGLVPHAAVPKKQHDNCDTCQHNAFGTADKGRGKRCQDRRALLFVAASDLEKFKDKGLEAGLAKAPLYQVSVPPGSLKTYGRYLKDLTDQTPNGNIREAITELSTEGLPGGAYALTFSFLGQVPREAMPFLFQRGKSNVELLMQPFPVIEHEAVKPQDNRPVKGQGKKR